MTWNFENLLNSEGDGGPLVVLGLVGISHKGLDAVLDAKGLAVVFLAGLEGDGGRGVSRELEGERESIRAELLHQLLLDRCQLFLASRGNGYNLFVSQNEFFAEFEAHDLIFFATISVGGRELYKNI